MQILALIFAALMPPQWTERVNVSSTGQEASTGGRRAAISAGGRYAAFLSGASELVDPPMGGIFVHDTLSGRTACAVPDFHVIGEPSISANGRYITYTHSPLPSGGWMNVFVHDRQRGTDTCASLAADGGPANNHSAVPRLSPDGRYVAFQSAAYNLVPGMVFGTGHVYLRDIAAGVTTLASITPSGTTPNNGSIAPSISLYGRQVAFESLASNLVDDDTNGTWDVFVHETATGKTRLVSRAMNGKPAKGWSVGASISWDGRFVAFVSGADDLVPGDTNQSGDVFVRDLALGETRRVSVSSQGVEANWGGGFASISARGRYVAFQSWSQELVPGGWGVGNIFVHDCLTGITEQASVASDGSQGNYPSQLPAISADGRAVAFESMAFNLVPNDTNNVVDVFVRWR